MELLNAIILDDEVNAIKTLKWELNSFDSMVNVVDSFTKPEKAIEFLTYTSEDIDIIFLDIQMPRMNGFEFLDHFKNRSFEVIFITAYDEYAIKAIKESALDYILKPVDEDELEHAIKKVSTKLKKSKPTTDKITLPFENKLMFLNPKDIIYCKSDGNYCHIITKDDNYLLSKTLKHVESLIPSSCFFRIHQSYVINLKKVKFFNKSTNSVVLTNNKELPVSRAKRGEFLELL